MRLVRFIVGRVGLLGVSYSFLCGFWKTFLVTVSAMFFGLWSLKIVGCFFACSFDLSSGFFMVTPISMSIR